MGSIRNMMSDGLPRTDPELFRLIQIEKRTQLQSLELIASENYPSYSALQSYVSCFNNKYSKLIHKNSEGDIEGMCEKRCLQAFNLNDEEWGANVRAYSGAIANLAVYIGLCNPHDRIMGLEYLEGGHYTHGYMKGKQKLTATSLFYETLSYKLDPKTGLIDYDKLAESARHFSPKVIIAGVACYSRCLDYKRFREIADEVGAFLVADMAHVSGLVATDLIDSPFKYCDVVTSCTYKSLRGTKGAVIFYKKNIKLMNDYGQYEEHDLDTRINKAVFPGLIGGCMMNVIAAIATVMKEVTTPAFKRYQTKTLENAKTLCSGLQSLGYEIVTGGTDIHMMLVNVGPKGLIAAQAEFILEEVNISTTSFPVPGDKPGTYSHGLRIGTPALTTRGLNDKDIEKVINYFDEGIKIAMETRSKTGVKSLAEFKKMAREDPEISLKIKKLKAEISAFAENFNIPGMEDV